jgi:phage gp36-like protein
MSYCTETDLTPYLLADYIAAAEIKTPGIVSEHITRVSGQIDAYIGERYELPLPTVPQILNWAASVMVAYRVIGSITSLVSTEGETNNEFVYLQGEYKRAIKTLEDIRDGKIELFPGSDDEELQDDKAVSVVSSPRIFTDDMLGRY